MNTLTLMHIDENAKPLPTWMNWGDKNAFDMLTSENLASNKWIEKKSEFISYENMGNDKNDSDAILPGVGQRIINLLNNGARRKMEKGATLYALQILSSLMPKSIKGYDGALSTLITFSIAPTASGKEFPQKIMREMCINAGLSISSKPTSEKSILETAFMTKGRLIYTNDEAHTFISTMGDSKTADYAKGIESILLSLGSSSDLTITETLKKELKRDNRDEIQKIKKSIDELDNPDSATFNRQVLAPSEKDKYRVKERDRLKKLEDDYQIISSGMLRDVRMNLALATTPIAAQKAVKPDMLEKGLWGRVIFSCGNDERSEKNKNRISDDEIEGEIYALNLFFRNSSNKCGFIRATYDAELLLKSIEDKLELNEFRNHPTLGGLYARAYELITKIASLMAWCNDDMTITKVQAQAAINIVDTSIKEIGKFVVGNESMSDSTSANYDFKMKILQYLAKKTGHYVYRSTIEKELVERNKNTKEINERWKINGKTLFEQVLNRCTKDGLISFDGKRSYAIAQDGINEMNQ